MALATGPKVVLTREAEDNRELACLLSDRGIPSIEIPCVATRFLNPPTPAGRFDAIAFTSRRAVNALYSTPLRDHLFGKSETRPLIAAVGKSTARALAEVNLSAGIISDSPSGASLGIAISSRLKSGSHVLLVCGTLTTGTLREALEKHGILLDEIPVYENYEPAIPIISSNETATVFFASPSAARRFIKSNPWALHIPLCAIGETTRLELQRLGAVKVMETGIGIEDQLNTIEKVWQSCINPRGNCI